MSLVKHALIRLAGDLDVATTPTLLERGQFTPQPGLTITLDMSEVTFIDAAALSEIVTLRNDVLAAGGSLRFKGVPTPVARIITVAGLAPIL